MKKDEFWSILEKNKNKAKWFKIGDTGVLRTHPIMDLNYCPITYVNKLVNDEELNVDEWRKAANHLKLNQTFAKKILYAADNFIIDSSSKLDSKEIHSIRNRLLKLVKGD